MSDFGRMRPVTTDVDLQWIRTGVLPFQAYAVGSLVPAVFESYGRILHPAWTASGEAVRWDRVAAWSGGTPNALAQFDPLARPRGDPSDARPFERRPDDGALPQETLGAICEVLSGNMTTADRVYAGVWEGRGWRDPGTQTLRLELPERGYLVFEGPLEGVNDIGWSVNGAFVREGPNVIWPADRSWYVASDVDLDYTYVGGSGRLIADLLADDRLEVWPAAPKDPITWDSDQINGQ